MLKKTLSQNRGMAVIEMIPIMIIMVLLINFSIGFFGIVHTANLNAIAARNYTFETMRNRSNLVYHRDKEIEYFTLGNRFNGIISVTSANSGQNDWVATARRLSWVQFFGGTATDGTELNREPANINQRSTHNNSSLLKLAEGGVRNDSIEVYNVWIRTLYGICVDSKCGD